MQKLKGTESRPEVAWSVGEGDRTKGHEETSGGDGNVKDRSLLIWSLSKIQIYISTYYEYVYLWMFPHLTDTYGIPNMRYSSHQ